MDIHEIDGLLSNAEKRLSDLDVERAELLSKIAGLRKSRKQAIAAQAKGIDVSNAPVRNDSPPSDKIALFRRLFRGRENVYPRRWENAKTGKSGYQPACGNEWVRGVCFKPKIKCGECLNRVFLPVADEVIRNHLNGTDPKEKLRGKAAKDYVVGVYPLLQDDTCWFLAADFDKAAWREDAFAYLQTCRAFNIPAALERSRSGKGGHIWIFFSEAISAALARKMGSFLLTETMERRPEIGFESYDRFFPNQDIVPQGGFGNLIALPFQKKPRIERNSVFLDHNFEPYADQWAFLSLLPRMQPEEVLTIVNDAQQKGRIIGVRMVCAEEDSEEPWATPPSRRRREAPMVDLPKAVEIILGNQVYIAKKGLPPALINKLIRLAAFQNPEFYRAQAMRLSTFGKPRIIYCTEDFSNHIGLPRGMLDEILDLLDFIKVEARIKDERVEGERLDVQFNGALLPEQQKAADNLLAHDTGVLAAGTAFGKTVVAAYLIAKRNANALVLVHRRQLMDQWIAQLSKFLHLKASQIGQIGSGKMKPSRFVDVALIPSLIRKGIVNDIVGEYGHLIVDECHHVSAVSFEQVIRQCKARYVAGLSATVARKDGRHPIVFMQCGPVRHRVDARSQAELRPFGHRVVVRKTNFNVCAQSTGEKDLPIQVIFRQLSADEERNSLILKDVVEAIESGRSPVLLTERKDHLQYFTEQLRSTCRNVISLRGGMGTKQRQALMQELASIPENEPRVLVATGRYLGEGFDDARLDTIFLAMPISWRGTVVQYAGRLHRIHSSKKEVLIYDYADLDVAALSHMHERRLKAYRSIGYTISQEGQATLNI